MEILSNADCDNLLWMASPGDIDSPYEMIVFDLYENEDKGILFITDDDSQNAFLFRPGGSFVSSVLNRLTYNSILDCYPIIIGKAPQPGSYTYKKKIEKERNDKQKNTE